MQQIKPSARTTDQRDVEQSLPSGRVFTSRILIYTVGYVLAACVVITLYLSGLLQLTSGQWRDFFAIVAGVLVLIFPAMIATHWRVFQRIESCLDAHSRGEAEGEVLSVGFATIADFPRYWYVWGVAWWALGGAAVGMALWLRHPDIGLFPPAIILTATVSAALITDIYYYLTVKQLLQPARAALAADLGDTDARERLTRSVSLPTKLLTAMTSVILVTLVFAAVLAQVSTERALASYALGSSRQVIAAAFHDADLRFEDVETRLERQGGTHFAVLLDSGTNEVIAGVGDALSQRDRDWIHQRGSGEGDSTDLGTGRAFAWRRLPDDRGVLVVGVPSTDLSVESGARAAFAGLIFFASLVAIGVAYLLARDIGTATERLRSEVARIAGGDLTPGEPLESEDEMGELARSFENMTGALRMTVERVTGAADRMQSAAAEIADASRNVAQANEAQVEGIDRASGSMGEIDQQVGDIARSAERLCLDVESASSAILQLQNAGGELRANATQLSTSVDEVAGSIEEMAGSINEVATSSDAVAEAAEGASSSMQETSAAVRQVTESATSMSGLSERVIELSEQGNERVQETVIGMDSISEATDAAQKVIANLAVSAGQIDTVISVIDEVADETSLLALNAAIIAAQAGEQGRPFAVVAAQVKELAGKVRSSTAEITELIRELQQQSGDASQAIERGADLVMRGVERSGEAGSSLDAITHAARDSGMRVAEIVNAMDEQSKAVTVVAELMSRVREGTEQIRYALKEQGHNTTLLRQSSSSVGDVSKQVQSTSVEHAQSTSSIGHDMQNVQESVDLIKGALQDQSLACRSAVEFLNSVSESTRSNENSVDQLDESMRSLQLKADELHAEVARFRT